MKLQLILVSTLSLIITFNSFAQTVITGGEVSGTWELAKSPYHIDGNLSIPDDSTLLIEAGVTVEFQGHFALTVLGRLLAVGTEADSILFTIHDTTGFMDPDTALGGWNGIRFIDTPLHNDSSKIVHCCLEYSKAVGPVWHLNSGGAICIVQFGKVLISDCLIKSNSAGSSTDHPSQGGGLYLFKSDVRIRDNIFMNNRAHTGGAVQMDDSNPVFSNNIIESNHAVYGGGIFIGGVSHPSFTNDRILNNIAENNGGGLLLTDLSVLTCDRVTLRRNKAIWGGGIGVGGGELRANDCLIMENQAEIWGGGVAGDFATMHFTDCAFERNGSNWGSGGLHMDHATANISNCTFLENSAVFGGGFHSVYSQITSMHNEFLNNQTEGGGGVHIEDSDCRFEQCYFRENMAFNGTGGAIDYTVDSTIFGRKYRLMLSKSSFTENAAFSNSGAVRIEQTQSDSSLVDVVVDSCQFTGNHADVYGSLRIGGNMEDIQVSNSIFKSNTSSRYVGGLGLISNAKGSVYNCVFNSNYSAYSDSTKTAHGASLGSGAEINFLNCTFVDTSSSDGVGLSVRRGGKINLVNSIFWGCGDRPINIVTAAGLGCEVTINYCNIEFGIDSIYVSDSLSALSWGQGNFSEDPLFVDLPGADLHLRDSSPCIGKGSNSFIINDIWVSAPIRDLEGSPRPSPLGTEADMGAYEHALGFPVSIGPDPFLIPDKVLLYQNHPNPFKRSTSIRYYLSDPCKIELSIYNLYGQQIEILVSEYQSAGMQQVEWSGNELASGYYLYRLRTDQGIVKSGKLLMLR